MVETAYQRRVDLDVALGEKWLLITDQREDIPDLYHLVFVYQGDQAFLDQHMASVLLFLRQPEITGVVVSDTTLFESPKMLEVVLNMAARQLKKVRFCTPEPAMTQLDLDRFVDGELRKRGYGTLDFPREYSIITGRANCNIQCRMCPQATTTYKRKLVMSPDTLRRALECVPRDKQIKVSLTPFAEPFGLPGWMDLLRIACKMLPNAHITFNTNGTLMTEEICRELVSLQLGGIHFSLNMNNREDFLWFTGRDLYDAACENIRTLRRVRDEAGSSRPHMTVQLMDIPRNQNQKASFKREWGSVADQVFFRGVGDWGGNVDVDEEVCEGIPQPEMIKEHFPCMSPWMSMTVNWDGNIFACCFGGTSDSPIRGSTWGMSTPTMSPNCGTAIGCAGSAERITSGRSTSVATVRRTSRTARASCWCCKRSSRSSSPRRAARDRPAERGRSRRGGQPPNAKSRATPPSTSRNASLNVEPSSLSATNGATRVTSGTSRTRSPSSM